MISTISLNAPGLSGNNTDNFNNLLIAANPLSTICPKRYMSTFPPANTATTFFPGDGFFDIKYARPTAPAGSTTNFILSINRNIALVISSSSTKTISSIKSLIMLKVISPGILTEIPSAIVLSPPQSFLVLSLTD